MIGVLGGLGAAALWGTSTVAAARSTRLIGSQAALAYVMAVGLAASLVVALAGGPPANATPRALAWALTAGLGSVAGLSLSYRALRIGRVGVVAPIVATEGGLAAVVAFGLGERISAAVAVALAVMVAGVVLVTYRHDEQAGDRRALVLAALAAMGFAVSLVASPRASHGLGPFWTILLSRVLGVAVIALPLLARGRLPPPGRAFRFVGFSGLAEVGGFGAYIVGARHGVAVPAVLGSQFAAVAAAWSYLFFGDRLTRSQLAGTVTILVGVAAVSALRA